MWCHWPDASHLGEVGEYLVPPLVVDQQSPLVSCFERYPKERPAWLNEVIDRLLGGEA